MANKTKQINNNVAVTGVSSRRRRAFTFLEMITVLTISSMIITSVIMICSRTKRAAASINRKLDGNALPKEILQRIAEDLDRLAAPGFNTSVTIENKLSNNYNIARLIIENKYYNSASTPVPKTFEKVVWQSIYEPLDDALTLYRSHSGINLEDKIIDGKLQQMQEAGAEIFVPICTGITYFEIFVPRGKEELKRWIQNNLPPNLVVRISLADFVENEFGEFEIPEGEIASRAIAIDRTRKIAFKAVRKQFGLKDPAERMPDEDPNGISFNWDINGENADPAGDGELAESAENEEP